MLDMKRRDFVKAVGTGAAATAMLGPLNAMSKVEEALGKATRPNILFLMVDQYRWDGLGCAGNQVIQTPNLDALAADGVRFASAYSCTPTCTPARAALLTGQAPWHHGMLGYGRVAQKYPVEMPQALRDAGYYTFGVGKMHWYPQKALHGFHGTLVDESGRVESPDFVSDYRKWFRKQAPGQDPDATGVGWNDYEAKPYALDERLHPTVWTAQTAIDQINKFSVSTPFFLKVSFARPHSPYDPPSRFMNLYREEDMPGPTVGSWSSGFAEPKPHPGASNLYHGNLGPAQVKKSKRGYYGSITFIDEQIGRILQTLKDKGMYDDTLIVFTSDHGDMLADHHHWRKSYAYEGSAHIPMLLRWPKAFGFDDKRGTSLAQPMELRDLLPTFLDAAGADIPESVDGASMLDLVRGNTNGWREFIDLEHNRCYTEQNHWNALTDGHQKYLYFAQDGSEQLFDLDNDPGEAKDLSAEQDYRTTMLKWRKRMIEHLSERGEEFVAGGQLVVGRKDRLYSPNYPA